MIIAFPLGVWPSIFGATIGITWAITDIAAYSRGLPLPTADVLGVLRGVVYVPLFTAIILRQLGVPIDLVTLTFGVGIASGILATVAVWHRLSI